MTSLQLLASGPPSFLPAAIKIRSLLLQNALVQVALSVAAIIIYISKIQVDGCSAARPEGCAPIIGAPIPALPGGELLGSYLQGVACQAESLPLAQVAAALYATHCVRRYVDDLLAESTPACPPSAPTGRQPVDYRYIEHLACCLAHSETGASLQRQGSAKKGPAGFAAGSGGEGPAVQV